jgi:hypothetical protein
MSVLKEQIKKMNMSELKEGLDALQISWRGMTERSELEDALIAAAANMSRRHARPQFNPPPPKSEMELAREYIKWSEERIQELQGKMAGENAKNVRKYEKMIAGIESDIHELQGELHEMNSEWKGSPRAYTRRSRRAKSRRTRSD